MRPKSNEIGSTGLPVALKNPLDGPRRGIVATSSARQGRSDEADTRAGDKMLDHGADSADLALERQATWGMSAKRGFWRMICRGGEMLGFFSKGNKWDPSLQRFPEINIERIAKDLRIAKRGHEDGAREIPSSDAMSQTTAEMAAVEAVRRLRREALSNFDLEVQAYKQRINGTKSDSSEIKLKIGDAISTLERLEKEEELHLEPTRRDVAAYQIKLSDFLSRNKAVAPPRPRTNLFFTLTLLLFLLALESVINGQLFAERNEMGIVGGVVQAFLISAINIALGMLAGIYQRKMNLPNVGGKLIGFSAVIAWLAIALPFNFAVAHFRDALETSATWGEALHISVAEILTEPLGLDSLASWMLLIIGLLVTLVSFIKGLGMSDPIPGFNAIWDHSERAISGYANGYSDAHRRLDQEFQEQRNQLQSEVERRRVELRSAADALFSRSAMSSGMSTFLETTNLSVNQLLKMYREANQRARKTAAPKYFDDMFVFEVSTLLDVDDPGLGRNFVDVEITKMGQLVDVGVSHLMAAQKRSLLAFPNVQDIRTGVTERNEIEGDSPLKKLAAAIEELTAVAPAVVDAGAVNMPVADAELDSEPRKTDSTRTRAKRQNVEVEIGTGN